MPVNFTPAKILSFQEANPMLVGMDAGSDLLTKMGTGYDTAKTASYYKRALADYYQSPALQERGLTTLGKYQVEPGIIDAINERKNGGRKPQNVPYPQQQGYGYNQPQPGYGSNPPQPGYGYNQPQQNPPQGYAGNPQQAPQQVRAGDQRYEITGTEGQGQRAGNPQQVPQQNPPQQEAAEEGKGGGQSRDDLYNLAIQKATTDAKIRERALFYANAETTRESINPDHLFQYSGPQGNMKKMIDAVHDMHGKTPQRYIDYQKSEAAVKLYGKQLRQFYGASITPEMDRQITEMTNPNSFFYSPEIAQKKFNTLVDIVQKEGKNIQQGLQNTRVYGNEGQLRSNTSKAKNTAVRNEINKQGEKYKNQMIEMEGPDPKDDNKIKTWLVPQGQVQLYLKNNFKRKN